MFFFSSPLSLASALLLGTAQATYFNSELSFGHSGIIAPNHRDVPNFRLSGKPNPPDILSNKLVLTPPAPGNQRGAVWAEQPLLHGSWTVDVDFRATGPERGGGKLNIWYARNGEVDIGTESIYTVGKFDGLALVIDQHSGSGGFIRGFLNDGSTDYKSHHNPDSLAFGHCDYSYRNLGRPSRLAIRQSSNSFKVTIDGNPCFESKKIKLPLGNFFGLTAQSAENPDSFEVFKLVTTTDQHQADGAGQEELHDTSYAAAGGHNEQEQGKPLQPPQRQGKLPIGGANIPMYSENDNTPASQFSSSAEQFADLHNRLQSMMKYITQLTRNFDEHKEEQSRRHDSLLAKLQILESSIRSQESVPNILRDIQSDVRATKADLHEAFNQQSASIKVAVRDTHHSVIGTMANSGHGLVKLFFLVVASNVVVGGAYVLYKRRIKNGPKKYL